MLPRSLKALSSISLKTLISQYYSDLYLFVINKCQGTSINTITTTTDRPESPLRGPWNKFWSTLPKCARTNAWGHQTMIDYPTTKKHVWGSASTATTQSTRKTSTASWALSSKNRPPKPTTTNSEPICDGPIHANYFYHIANAILHIKSDIK